MAGWLLSGFGYQPNAQQTPLALRGIHLTVSVIPATLLLVCIVCVICYKITKKLNIQIQDELAERRTKYATAAGGVQPAAAK